METVLIAVVALLAGILAGYLFGKNKMAGAAMEVEVLKARLADRERAAAEAAKVQEASHNRALNALQEKFDETVARMQEQLKNVTARILRERQSEFEASSREGMSRILQPLETTIREMKATMADNTQKHSEFSGVLSANMENLLRHSDAARRSADRLANALRVSGKVQGDWGETVLAELLSSQGLREGVHFDTQYVIRDEAGNAVRSSDDRTMRPDVVLHLDREREVIIDAKVSMSAYLDYVNAESEEARGVALRTHVESIRKHVKELAAKDYSSYIRPPKRSAGYVIMFVPNTAALHLATTHSPELWRKAMEQNVYIADEQTLYAALKIIDLTWAQIAQEQNHEKVYGLAEEMLKRVGIFMEKYVAIGKNLDAATKAYGDGLAKLQDGGASIPQTCTKLVALGAKPQPRRGVPASLLGLEDS